MASLQNIKPLFDYVLVRPIKQDTKTAGGIYLPDTAQEKPQMAEVIAVGSGKTDAEGKKIEMVIKKGQKVLYKKWGGNEVKQGNEEVLLIEQKDIMAVVE